MTSYSGKLHGLPVFLRDAVELHRQHAADIPEKVRRYLDDLCTVEQQVRDDWGMDPRTSGSSRSELGSS